MACRDNHVIAHDLLRMLENPAPEVQDPVRRHAVENSLLGVRFRQAVGGVAAVTQPTPDTGQASTPFAVSIPGGSAGLV